MNRKNKKKTGIGKIILLVVGLILLTAVIVVLTAGASLLMKYSKNSYEYVPPVERESEFVMPDYPEVVIDPNAEWMEDDVTFEETIPAIETEPGAIETTLPETETAPAPETETEPAEIEPETEAPRETDDGSVKENVPNFDPAVTDRETVKETQKEMVKETRPYVPPETLPQIVNPTPETKAPETAAPETQPAETIVYDRNASFANSANAVSVYGKTPIYKVNQKNSDIVNVLVMGTDSRDVTLDRGRSDTMIVVSYNAKTGEVKLTSLLRDSLIYIEGVGWNRINTAYFYGGVGLAINTVNQLYNLDIQQFIVIDFNGVKNFFDYIGGVELTFSQEEIDLYNLYWGTSLEAGTHQCTSRMIMSHMQNRTIGSDFERTRRQRDVITAVVRKILGEKSAAEIYDIVDYAFGLIKTNIPATDLVSYAASVLGNASKLSIQTQNVPYTDAYQYARYNGMSIITYDIADAARRINEFIYGK